MNGTGLQILVADDHVEIHDFFNRVLTPLGYVCDTATTGKQCVEQVKQKPYDVLFLDLVLPDGDGSEILKQVRGHCPGMNIIICSSSDDHEIIDQVLSSGASAYMIKPFSADEIKTILNTIHVKKTTAGIA
jgi:two-component system, chemotaxis family, chemotaxis protein CheY